MRLLATSMPTTDRAGILGHPARGARVADPTDDAGSALVVVLLLGVLLGALGVSAALVVDVETTVSANHRLALTVRHAAMGGADVVVQELAVLADWSPALSGATASIMRGPLVLPPEAGGSAVDASGLTAQLQQHSYGAGGWGLNTPRWRLFGHAAVDGALSAPNLGSGVYLLVWLSDDIGESDDDPWTDGNGVVVVRARAIGPRGSQCDVQIVVERVAPGIVRRISSRVIR